ncbi:hypothetical protein B2J95_12590 [Enterobacter cloacae]|nr:hypothetical protein B2J95_12590 [Enterobacter cloacae]KTJ73697.1 hypothetical protein ASU78_18615 [Enterobacter cloacae subsp. cloacae]
MYSVARAFGQSLKAERRFVPCAIVDALDIVEDVAVLEFREGLLKVNTSIFFDVLVVMLTICLGYFFWYFLILVNIQNRSRLHTATGGKRLVIQSMHGWPDRALLHGIIVHYTRRTLLGLTVIIKSLSRM